MKISVIMGIYNCAMTLPEALDSIFNQTYRDFEIILCDDGSKDNTYEVAMLYAQRYNNVVLIKNEINRGLNYTLNHCLKYAKGEYIARMDGDDISLSTRFEKGVAILDNNSEIAIVSCAMIYFDENGDYKIGNPKQYPTARDFVAGTPFAHAPCMVRKVAYDAVNGYSEGKKFLRCEDYHLWFKMYAKGFIGYNIGEALYKMRDDRNAYSRRKYKYRINEAYVKFIGFRMLNIPLHCYISVLRPLIVGILPYRLYAYLRNRK